MNQANEDSNIVIAGIQAVETERGIEAPVYKKGPKMIAIRMGQDVQEISTRTSQLLENGELQDENENKVTMFDKTKMQELKEERENRKTQTKQKQSARKTEKIVPNKEVVARRTRKAKQEDERAG